jgi:hypothetical protein
VAPLARPGSAAPLRRCSDTNIGKSLPLAARYLPLVASRWSSEGGRPVLRRTGVGTSARVAGRAGWAGVLVTLVCALSASSAPADRRPQPSAEELWRSYPLEQRPTTTAAAPPAAPSRRASSPAAADASDSGVPWAALVALGAASAVVAAIVAARRRRRPAAATVPALPAAPAVSMDAAAPAASTGQAVARSAPGPLAPRPAAAAAATVAARAARGPAPPSGGSHPSRPGATGADPRRPNTARQATACQVRWSRRARRFYAVTVDAQGAERRVGRSPVLAGAPPGPPEETPEARAALRQLAKDVRERGWRPLRARGVDFGERQWYARRFRWPTEAEMQPGAADGDAPDRESAGHPGGAP